MKYKLGVGIPYCNNSEIARVTQEYLMEIIDILVTDLKDEVKVLIYQNNEGIAKARNKLMEELLPECSYITFIDSDDRISKDYFIKILEALKSEDNIYMVRFYVNNLEIEFEGLKNHATGVIYKNELIKNIRFDENRNIGEDTNFNNHFRKEVAKLIDTKYFYNYGINNECLCYKYSRGELQEFKIWN